MVIKHEPGMAWVHAIVQFAALSFVLPIAAEGLWAAPTETIAAGEVALKFHRCLTQLDLQLQFASCLVLYLLSKIRGRSCAAVYQEIWCWQHPRPRSCPGTLE